MLKIVIADDESHVRELIGQCINNSDIDMEVVGEAEDGNEAFELIERCKPDILITDVCMPDLDGLELLGKLKPLQEYEYLKTIIISGYDDFAYAKKAIQLGVNNYLLKPFSPEELFETLEHVEKEIIRKQNMINNMSVMVETYENNLYILQEMFLKKLMEGETTRGNEKERGKELKLDLDFKNYLVGLIKIKGSFSSGVMAGKEKEVIEKTLLLVKDRYFDQQISAYGFKLENNVIGVLFGSRSENKLKLYQSVQDGINKINTSLQKYYGLSLLCAIGGLHEEIDDVGHAYREALAAFQSVSTGEAYFVKYQGQTVMGNTAKPGETSSKYKETKELQSELCVSIKLGNSARAREILGNILSRYGKFENISSDNVALILLELTFSIENVLKETGVDLSVWDEVKLHSYVKNQLVYGSLIDIKSFMEDLLDKACTSFQNFNKSKNDKIVEKMKILIEHNLANEEFTLETLGAELFFSSNYLRKIFKQAAGEAFTDYLIRRRMEEAKRKLNDPVKKIQEVSLECGYSNQRYFASAFKKYYGCTPSQWREER